jgi:ABC-type uncharacterized transport system involved in gliding motility auxiliary subunit
MSKWIRFSGILGGVLVLFGILGGLIAEEYDSPLIAGHLILGVICLGAWLFASGTRGVASAGAVLKGRSARFGANVLIYTGVFVGVLVALNWIVHRHDRRYDLTEEGVYSLAPQSRDLVKGLQQPLKIVGFLVGDDPGQENQLRDLFARFKEANLERVTTELVDPRAKPHLVQTYGMKPGNVVYLELGDGETKATSRINDSSEEGITNAILKLTRGAAKKLYVVQGHGEPDITANDPTGLKGFADAIGDEHLTLAGLILGQHSKIPEDAAGVLLISPKKPLLAEERQLLINYVEGGGRLLLMADPRTTEDVRTIAAHFKIEVGNDVIIDQIQRLFAAPALGVQPIVTTYTPHPLTRNMSEREVTVFNLASSIRSVGTSDATSTWTDLAKTGLTAWAERNLEQLFDAPEAAAVRDPEDLVGPVTIAAAYERKLDGAKPANEGSEAGGDDFRKVARVVVFGDSDWILNANLAVYSNRDFALNAVNWLVGEEGGVTIRPRQMRVSLAPMSQETFVWLLISSFLVPELILIVGLAVWWRRKSVAA